MQQTFKAINYVDGTIHHCDVEGQLHHEDVVAIAYIGGPKVWFVNKKIDTTGSEFKSRNTKIDDNAIDSGNSGDIVTNSYNCNYESIICDFHSGNGGDFGGAGASSDF